MTEAAFWVWFKDNEDLLFNFEKDPEGVFKVLATRLREVNKDLTFEFGPEEDGQREFVVSAGGNRSSFPVVISLVDAAPSLPRWKLIKFRQRRELLGLIQVGTFSINLESVKCSLRVEGDKVGITLFFGESDLDETMRNQLGYLLLDSALGEYDVETFVGRIDFHPAKKKSNMERIPFRTLTKAFDTLIKSVTN